MIGITKPSIVLPQANVNIKKEFPHNIPADEDVELRMDLSTVRKLEESPDEIFCALCTLPMHIKIVLIPCKHRVCVACFQKFNQECKYCGFEICDIETPENLL